jgi:ligand-binding sensor domain-containing protein
MKLQLIINQIRMKKSTGNQYFRIAAVAVIVLAAISLSFMLRNLNEGELSSTVTVASTKSDSGRIHTNDKQLPVGTEELSPVPVYGKWRNFTTKDGLPSDKAYCVRIDGDRVLVGTHDGLAVYQNGKWSTYTTKDGLAHNGIVSIDVSELTGDVWIGTLGGLSRWSAGKFETFNQFNSGMPNDLVYCVICDGKDVWVATGGGAGHYDTFTREWEIFTEKNAPMHEPWTYGVSAGDGKIFIAAWGGGVIEYNTKTKQFRDYTDPDGFMEIDLQPDDGVVHDITTATSWADGILWVSTYFGMSRYDGKYWKGYFDHDSGLASNFINFLRAEGPVVFVCSDKGLSSTNGESWVTYKKNDNNENGVAIITNGKEKREIPLSPSIAHNYIIGVDGENGVLWVATSKGVSRGEIIK